MRQKKNTKNLSIERLEGKRAIGRHRRRWDDSIRKELWYDWVVWSSFIPFRKGTSGCLL
jgi:hypothetical protein